MAMISRKKILSRSQSEFGYEPDYNPYECEEDVWFNKEKLYSDHIQEILNKWEQIDDEIWGKIIYMERNRRIAKAYARAPILTIDGSEDGFDGHRIGLNGFESFQKDSLIRRVKRHIGQGVRVRIDETGNIIVKRLSNCDVFVGGWDREANSMSKEIIDLSGQLEYQKSVKMFDMKKFQNGVSKELRSAYPDRRKLEHQCISVLGFVKDSTSILDYPVWCLIVNIVALDMLKSKLPPIASRSENVPKFVSIFEKGETNQDEDPYSVPALPARSKPHPPSETIARKITSEPKPPELPPRDLSKIKKSKGKGLPKVFRSFVKHSSAKENVNNQQQQQQQQQQQTQRQQQKQQTVNQSQLKDDKDYEDPYYCGMRARVCNNGPRERDTVRRNLPYVELRKTHSNGYLNSLFSYQKRPLSYYSQYDSSLESDPYALSSNDYEIYGPIYGRVRNNEQNIMTNNSYRATLYNDRDRYASEWD